MPIRAFDSLLATSNLTHTAALSSLSECRVGIDIRTYLLSLLQSAATREPLTAAVGGGQLSLLHFVESDLRALEKCKIKPVFVFDGISLAHAEERADSEARSSGSETALLLAGAWADYENENVDDAVAKFGDVQVSKIADLQRAVLKLFRHRLVEFVVAPYSALAQLVYLQSHPKSFIHAIYASTDILLYSPIDKLITSLDLPASKFVFVSKKEILSELSLSDDQFLDLGLLAGCDACPTFPPAAAEFKLKGILSTLNHFKSGWASIMALELHPGIQNSNYLDVWRRARTSIKYALILIAEEGRVMPLPMTIPPSATDIPVDLYDVFSHRLPDEVYFHLCRAFISACTLDALTQGIIRVERPLEGGDLQEFRKFVTETINENPTGSRCVAIALAAQALHPWWRTKPVMASYYYSQEQRAIPHMSTSTQELIKKIDSWNVPAACIEDELRRQSSSTIDMQLCLGATSGEKVAARTRIVKRGERLLERKDEICANIIWRTLELRGLFTANHTHTPWARALYAGMRESLRNDKFQEPLFLVVELLRAELLHGAWFSGVVFSGGPSFGEPAEQRSMLILIRTLSIIPLIFKPQEYSGPLSRELLAFNSFLNVQTRSLRYLIETVGMNMLLRGDARRSREDYLDISLSYPFQQDVNSAFGIFFKVYLDAFATFTEGQMTPDPALDATAEQTRLEAAKRQARDLLEDILPNIKNTETELLRGFRFWDCVMCIIKSAKTQKIMSPELVSHFEEANAWLKPMRPLT